MIKLNISLIDTPTISANTMTDTEIHESFVKLENQQISLESLLLKTLYCDGSMGLESLKHKGSSRYIVEDGGNLSKLDSSGMAIADFFKRIANSIMTISQKIVAFFRNLMNSIRAKMQKSYSKLNSLLSNSTKKAIMSSNSIYLKTNVPSMSFDKLTTFVDNDLTTLDKLLTDCMNFQNEVIRNPRPSFILKIKERFKLSVKSITTLTFGSGMMTAKDTKRLNPSLRIRNLLYNSTDSDFERNSDHVAPSTFFETKGIDIDLLDEGGLNKLVEIKNRSKKSTKQLNKTSKTIIAMDKSIDEGHSGYTLMVDIAKFTTSISTMINGMYIALIKEFLIVRKTIHKYIVEYIKGPMDQNSKERLKIKSEMNI